MERIDLRAQLRSETGKGPARRYRQRGLIPAVFYGAKLNSISLTLDLLEFKKSLKGKAGENVLINLNVEGRQDIGPQVAMIRDLQLDPVKREIIHVDLHKIDLEKKVEVAVPIELVGKAAGVKLGGILQQIERELEIRCMPLQIPNQIEVDVSNLGIGESIHVRNLAIGEGIEILISGEQTVVTILSPKVEVEKVEEEVVEEGAPSVEKEKKESESES